MARGRPREFDPEKALDRAVETFWQRGYCATSVSDVAKAIGITKPSLYGAFGNKEQLFLSALDRYIAKFGGCVLRAMAGKADVHAAIRAYLDAVVEQLSDPTLPAGCLRVNSTLECRGFSDVIDRKLIEYQAGFEQALYERLRQGLIQGQLPAESDLLALARFFVGIVNAMAVRARINPDPSVLHQLVDMGMRVWPNQKSASTW